MQIRPCCTTAHPRTCASSSVTCTTTLQPCTTTRQPRATTPQPVLQHYSHVQQHYCHVRCSTVHPTLHHVLPLACRVLGVRLGFIALVPHAVLLAQHPVAALAGSPPATSLAALALPLPTNDLGGGAHGRTLSPVPTYQTNLVDCPHTDRISIVGVDAVTGSILICRPVVLIDVY